MATLTQASPLEAIGTCAGDVWQYLDTHGPTGTTQLLHGVKVPRDLLFQAIGWLAREGKIVIDEEGRKKVFRCR